MPAAHVAAAPDAAAHDVQLGRCAGSTDPAEFKAHLEALTRACAALAEENEVAKVRRWADAAAPAAAAAATTEGAEAAAPAGDAEHAAAVEKLVQAARDKAAAVSRLDSKKCEVEETARKLSRNRADVRRLEQALGEQQAKNAEDARQLAAAERALAPSAEEEAAAALPAPAAAPAAPADEGADAPDPAEAERAVWVRCAAAKAIKQQLLRKLPPAQAGGGGGSSLRPLTASERAGVLRATGAQGSFHAQMLCGGCTGALRSYAGQPAQGATLSTAAAAPLALAGPTPSNPPSTAPPTAPSSVYGDSVSGGAAAATGPFHQEESSNVYWHKELHGAPVRMARPTHPYTLR